MNRPRVLAVLVLALSAAGCGSHRTSAPGLERRFAVDWHDHAAQVAVSYTTQSVVFHAGRWSARVIVRNETGRPLYEAVWSPPGNDGSIWNGPALVYSGLDVLGDRRLLFAPADRESPAIPVPLPNGATWRGTISGKVPEAPTLPRRAPIWFRYPVFGLGQTFDETTPSLNVLWISSKAIKL